MPGAVRGGALERGAAAEAERLFGLANEFHAKGEVGKAVDAFKKVLELAPDHTDAAVSLSVLYNDIGHYESARRLFERADQRVKGAAGSGEPPPADGRVNRRFSARHFELAEMYMAHGRFDEALFEYNKAASLDPGNVGARIKVSKVYAKKKFFNKAVEELRRLKTERPGCQEARVALGVLYYGLGRVLEAQNEWERVLAQEPGHEEAKMYLGLSKTATETRI